MKKRFLVFVMMSMIIFSIPACIDLDTLMGTQVSSKVNITMTPQTPQYVGQNIRLRVSVLPRKIQPYITVTTSGGNTLQQSNITEAEFIIPVDHSEFFLLIEMPGRTGTRAIRYPNSGFINVPDYTPPEVQLEIQRVHPNQNLFQIRLTTSARHSGIQSAWLMLNQERIPLTEYRSSEGEIRIYEIQREMRIGNYTIQGFARNTFGAEGWDRVVHQVTAIDTGSRPSLQITPTSISAFIDERVTLSGTVQDPDAFIDRVEVLVPGYARRTYRVEPPRESYTLNHTLMARSGGTISITAYNTLDRHQTQDISLELKSNRVPQVTLTRLSGDNNYEGTVHAYTINAFDSDGLLDRVVFLANGEVVQQAQNINESMKSMTVNWVVRRGTNVLKAYAIDDKGARGESEEIIVVGVVEDTQPPTVRILLPSHIYLGEETRISVMIQDLSGIESGSEQLTADGENIPLSKVSNTIYQGVWYPQELGPVIIQAGASDIHGNSTLVQESAEVLDPTIVKWPRIQSFGSNNNVNVGEAMEFRMSVIPGSAGSPDQVSLIVADPAGGVKTIQWNLQDQEISTRSGNFINYVSDLYIPMHPGEYHATATIKKGNYEISRPHHFRAKMADYSVELAIENHKIHYFLGDQIHFLVTFSKPVEHDPFTIRTLAIFEGTTQILTIPLRRNPQGDDGTLFVGYRSDVPFIPNRVGNYRAEVTFTGGGADPLRDQLTLEVRDSIPTITLSASPSASPMIGQPLELIANISIPNAQASITSLVFNVTSTETNHSMTFIKQSLTQNPDNATQYQANATFDTTGASTHTYTGYAAVRTAFLEEVVAPLTITPKMPAYTLSIIPTPTKASYRLGEPVRFEVRLTKPIDLDPFDTKTITVTDPNGVETALVVTRTSANPHLDTFLSSEFIPTYDGVYQVIARFERPPVAGIAAPFTLHKTTQFNVLPQNITFAISPNAILINDIRDLTITTRFPSAYDPVYAAETALFAYRNGQLHSSRGIEFVEAATSTGVATFVSRNWSFHEIGEFTLAATFITENSFKGFLDHLPVQVIRDPVESSTLRATPTFHPSTQYANFPLRLELDLAYDGEATATVQFSYYREGQSTPNILLASKDDHASGDGFVRYVSNFFHVSEKTDHLGSFIGVATATIHDTITRVYSFHTDFEIIPKPKVTTTFVSQNKLLKDVGNSILLRVSGGPSSIMNNLTTPELAGYYSINQGSLFPILSASSTLEDGSKLFTFSCTPTQLGAITFHATPILLVAQGGDRIPIPLENNAVITLDVEQAGLVIRNISTIENTNAVYLGRDATFVIHVESSLPPESIVVETTLVRGQSEATKEATIMTGHPGHYQVVYSSAYFNNPNINSLKLKVRAISNAVSHEDEEDFSVELPTIDVLMFDTGGSWSVGNSPTLTAVIGPSTPQGVKDLRLRVSIDGPGNYYLEQEFINLISDRANPLAIIQPGRFTQSGEAQVSAVLTLHGEVLESKNFSVPVVPLSHRIIPILPAEGIQPAVYAGSVFKPKVEINNQPNAPFKVRFELERETGVYVSEVDGDPLNASTYEGGHALRYTEGGDYQATVTMIPKEQGVIFENNTATWTFNVGEPILRIPAGGFKYTNHFTYFYANYDMLTFRADVISSFPPNALNPTLVFSGDSTLTSASSSVEASSGIYQISYFYNATPTTTGLTVPATFSIAPLESPPFTAHATSATTTFPVYIMPSYDGTHNLPETGSSISIGADLQIQVVFSIGNEGATPGLLVNVSATTPYFTKVTEEASDTTDIGGDQLKVTYNFVTKANTVTTTNIPARISVSAFLSGRQGEPNLTLFSTSTNVHVIQ